MKNVALPALKVHAIPNLVGPLHHVDGKPYILDVDQGLIYDAATEELVFDNRVIDKVFDLYEEQLVLAAAIRRKARELAHGNPAIEEALRLHFAFVGVSEEVG